ncbi:MAG: putative DNA binding domain-containing protein [Brumimicrobium sp.]|nr:putative DNA binding domain-containing protein [Brumimicrobium sp.]
MTTNELKHLKETEDKVEFKEAKKQYAYNRSRNSVLGYVVALANEGGGKLIFGVKENKNTPHEIVGSLAWKGQEGKLEQDIYRDIKVRVTTEELFEGENRILVIHVPSRPVGKTLKFEDVPLMRVGEELLPMSDEQIYKILQEQEPDFSAKVCKGLSLSDLDEQAIKKMKESYALKQNNPAFIQLSTEQALTDLHLLKGGKLNYAALILLAKKEVIQEKLPQSRTIWEFRNSEAQIYHDTRIVIEDPLFIGVDKIWRLINQPNLNRKHPVQSGAYIFDLFDFNEEVIREAILNAIAHRDYTITSEVVIKQYPNKISIINPGGFPKGVTTENILTVSSTPRSRLMTEVLEKTGLVERSGQGVDKIYAITLMEGKAAPDYSRSDMLQVELVLKTEISNKAFHVFINQYQSGEREPKLGVEQVITLYLIYTQNFNHLNDGIVEGLLATGLIVEHDGDYKLSNEFERIEREIEKAERSETIDFSQLLEIESTILKLIIQDNYITRKELSEQLEIAQSTVQVYLKNLEKNGYIKRKGKTRGSHWVVLVDYKG